MAILVKEKSNFGNSCIDTQHFGDFGPEKAKISQFLSRKCQAKGIIFAILKLWAAHPLPRFC